MIYLFSGDDAKEKIKNYESFLASLPAKKEIFIINRNNFDKMQLESLYSGSGLFFQKCVAVLENILEKEEHRDFILEKLPLMAESPNSFIFFEGKLLKPTTDAFKKRRSRSKNI